MLDALQFLIPHWTKF